MSRLLHRLRYFVGDAWDEWRHSPAVNVLAMGTLVSALFLAALVVLAWTNLDAQLDRERRLVQLHVYLRETTTEDTARALGREIAARAGVSGVEFVDAAEALRRYRRWAERSAELLEELGTNPLPASLEITLAPGPGGEQAGDALVAALPSHPAVEDVRFDREWLERLEALLGVARAGGSILGALIFAAVVFVMASVLRLAVYARREETEIMLLVGATPAFVRGPFLVAGLVQGIAAGLGALGLVELARRGLRLWVADAAPAVLDLVAARPLPLGASLLLLGIGLAVSLAGAFFAVRGTV